MVGSFLFEIDLGSAMGIHARMGADLAKLGGVMRCLKCGHEQPIDADSLADYLAKGWPRHCESSMRWLTAKELTAESNQELGS